MLFVAAGFLVVAGVLATEHLYDKGYDCGTAFAVNDPTVGRTEATVFGENASNRIDCSGPIGNRRAIAGGLAVLAVLLAAAALLGSGNVGSSTPRREREALRING